MKSSMERTKCLFHLRSCVWEITLACCFSCRYCGSKGGKARENELTTQECLRVAEQLSNLGCQRVSLIGGEVFMRPDWPAIVRALTERQIRVSVITNGYLFFGGMITRLKEAGIESVAVSLDGPEEIHDRFRQSGSYRRADSAIDVLSGSGIPVSVITTLHSGNVPYLESFYQYLLTKHIAAWQLQACSPMGNAANGGMDYRFDCNTVIDFVESKMFEAPFMMGVADNIGYFTGSEGYLRGNLSGSAYFRGCSAGLDAIGIDSVGNVRGCEAMYDSRFIEGNLREKSLREIWESPDAFAYNRKFRAEMLTGVCGSCPYGSRCAGGCRSYNFFTHGKLYESFNCARNSRKNDV